MNNNDYEKSFIYYACIRHTYIDDLFIYTTFCTELNKSVLKCHSKSSDSLVFNFFCTIQILVCLVTNLSVDLVYTSWNTIFYMKWNVLTVFLHAFIPWSTKLH